MIKDRNIDYKYRIETIHASAMTSMGNLVGTEDGDADFIHPAGSNADALLTTFGSAGLVGWKMTTAGRLVRHLLYSPTYMDWENDIFFRVIWTSGSSTTADTIDWKVLLGRTGSDTAPTGAAVPLGPPIARDTVAAANVVQYTRWGTLIASTLVPDDTNFITVDVEMDAFAAGLSEDKGLLGVQIAYIPKLTDGPQVNDNASPQNVQ